MKLRTHLLNELTHRKNRNSAYSLRAFARDLGVGSTTLSDFLAQKRSFSKTNLTKVLEHLNLSPQMKNQFFVENKSSQKKEDTHREKEVLEEDSFRFIADWYYLAILGIAGLKENKADLEWLSRRLGIPEGLVNEALERLLRLKLIEIREGKITATKKHFTTTHDIPSAAIRKHHGQNLILAEKALHHVPVERRDFGSLTIPANPAKLAKAKDIIESARQKIEDLLRDDEATEVYMFTTQLFPLLTRD